MRERQLIKYLHKCGRIYILHLFELHTHNEQGPTQGGVWEGSRKTTCVCGGVRGRTGEGGMSNVRAGAGARRQAETCGC